MDLGFFAVLTRHFLNAIQPNDFPYNLAVALLSDYKDALPSVATINALLWYELGFLVCVAIGIMYMVLMPLIGGIMACCRCCGRCGGRMFQRQTPRTNIYRRALYCGLLTTTVLVLVGNIFMFKSNGAFKVRLDQISEILNDLNGYSNAVLEQFDDMMNARCNNVIDEMTKNIDNIHFTLGGEIQTSLRSVNTTLQWIGMTDLIHANTTNAIHNLSQFLNELQVEMEASKNPNKGVLTHIQDAKYDLEYAFIKNECFGNYTCEELLNSSLLLADIVTNKLILLQINFSYINQSLSNFQSVVQAGNWTSLIRKGEDFLENIPWKVSHDIRNVVQLMKNNLNDTKTQLSKEIHDSLVSVSTNVTDPLQQLQRTISMITSDVKRAKDIAWALGLALCYMVLFVVVCNTLGLVLGPLGLEPKADPRFRFFTAHRGGIVLLISAGFVLLFSWLFMGVVLMLFVPGGNMYALVCKPWNDGELLKIIDTPDVIGFELGLMLGLKNNLTLSDVYSDCQKNMSLWSTLHMNELMNLEEKLNVSSQYTDVILSNVSITPVPLLSIVKNQSKALYGVITDINFARYTHAISWIDSINLTKTKESLRIYIASDDTITPLIRDAAYAFGDAQGKLDNLKSGILNKLSIVIENLQSDVSETNRTISNVLDMMGKAQELINHKTQNIKTDHKAFVEHQLGNVTVTHAEWTNMMQQVGRREAVARVVDSLASIICDDMMEPLNTFWFSLAWCLIFFIPSIICSIKLAKYYRRMEEWGRAVE